jgi:cupin 2 domain-containing protein
VIVGSTMNLLRDIPGELPDELLETLFKKEHLRIERIVSHGHASPPDSWYDQDQNEWVLVVQGHARLQFEDNTIELKAGDYLNIPAHKRHRVEWTTPDEPTIWLAVFYD